MPPDHTPAATDSVPADATRPAPPLLRTLQLQALFGGTIQTLLCPAPPDAAPPFRFRSAADILRNAPFWTMTQLRITTKSKWAADGLTALCKVLSEPTATPHDTTLSLRTSLLIDR